MVLERADRRDPGERDQHVDVSGSLGELGGALGSGEVGRNHFHGAVQLALQGFERLEVAARDDQLRTALGEGTRDHPTGRPRCSRQQRATVAKFHEISEPGAYT